MKDEALLSQVVYEHVGGLTDLPCEFEFMPSERTKLPCTSVQTLTGDPVSKHYKSGAYIGKYRFAIYLRQSTTDTASRLDAAKTLTDLAAQIDGATIVLPVSFAFWGIEQDTLPVKIAVDEAYDDWQATFTLTYKKG